MTDLMMPEMNGIELWRQLRTLAPTLPVLLISGGSLQDIEQFVLPPELPFLPKPFKPSELLEAVERL